LTNRADGGGVVTLRLPLKPAEAEARPRLVMVVDDMAELRAARFAQRSPTWAIR
jgi:hypothetical protein